MAEAAPLDREAALREIASSRVQASWFMDGHDLSVNLSLSFGCKFGGVWGIRDDGVRYVSMLRVSVPESLRRAGIATRLVSALSHVVLTTGNFDTYGGAIESLHTIGLLDKLYGPENVSYQTDRPPIEDLTSDEARQLLANYEQHGRVVTATIRLDGFAPGDFEAPEIIVPPGH